MGAGGRAGGRGRTALDLVLDSLGACGVAEGGGVELEVVVVELHVTREDHPKRLPTRGAPGFSAPRNAAAAARGAPRGAARGLVHGDAEVTLRGGGVGKVRLNGAPARGHAPSPAQVTPQRPGPHAGGAGGRDRTARRGVGRAGGEGPGAGALRLARKCGAMISESMSSSSAVDAFAATCARARRVRVRARGAGACARACVRA